MKNRKTAVLLGAAALTAALGLGYGLLTGAEQAEESSSAAGVAAFSPTGAVSVICYENEGGEIALEYLDDTWTLRRDADFPVNQTSAESMANYLAPLNATALVTQSGADLVAYGLDEPSNRIEVATDAGETCTVLVGAQNTHTGEYYIKLEGEEPVYTVSESFAAAFTRTERGLQQTENWPVESTDSVTRATLEQGGNTLTVDVSEDADGNKTYTASDTARTETPDTAAAQAFISSAATLYFSSSALRHAHRGVDAHGRRLRRTGERHLGAVPGRRRCERRLLRPAGGFQRREHAERDGAFRRAGHDAGRHAARRGGERSGKCACLRERLCFRGKRSGLRVLQKGSSH